MEPKPKPEPAVATPASPDPWLESVRQAVANLRYGVVQITVHAGKVVQVERTERFRIDLPPAPPAGAAANPNP